MTAEDPPVCTATGKATYPTRGAAKAAAAAYRARGAARGGPVNAYPCSACKGFHIGHERKADHRRRRARRGEAPWPRREG